MILIADSGSTKTTWSLIREDGLFTETCETTGINPMYQDEETIYQLIAGEFNLQAGPPVHLSFYGAGCTGKGANETVRAALNRFFNPLTLSVDTDLLAAARSLCQDERGIACILGTGSNSCYYDGRAIRNNISPLGYMLGDEGSGAVIGRKFIGDLLKNQLSATISDRFYSAYDLTPAQIMEHVYKKPFPNRFLAQFTHFIHGNIHEPSMRNMVKAALLISLTGTSVNILRPRHAGSFYRQCCISF